MEFLKYLDVVIGLSLVMVLVSPMVTAGTQIWMWWRNRRTIFLQQMLYRLFVQIGGPRAALLQATVGGVAAPAIELVPLGTTDQQGRLWLPAGIDPAHVTNGTTTVTARTAAGPANGVTLTARFIPQTSFQNAVVQTPPSADGKAAVSYTYKGARALASTKAKLSVLNPANPAGGVTTSTFKWSVNKSEKQEFAVQPGTSPTIDLPPPVGASVVYQFEFELFDQQRAAVTGEVVAIELLRNEAGDRVESGLAPSGANGSITFALPRGMDPTLAKAVTDAVVRHPLLARSPVPWVPVWFPKMPPFKNRHAEVIEREELVRVLLELAAAQGEGADNLEPAHRPALRTVLALNGIPDPEKTLADIRAETQRLEAIDPQTAAHVRHTQAIVTAAHSDLVGKIAHWFDTAAARATQQYAAEARAATVIVALLVAVALQLDSFNLLRRLSSDPNLRNALVSEAREQQERIDKLTAAASTTQPGGANAPGGATNPGGANAPVGGTNPGGAASGAQQSGGRGASAGGAQQPASTPAGSAQQTPAPAGTDIDLALAMSKRDEIEKNLATLRAPAFSILPDHFIWEGLAKGRIDRNPMWTAPYPPTLALIAGGSTHVIRTRWRRDALADLKAALDASDAPVRSDIENVGRDVIVRSLQPLDLHIRRGTNDVAVPLASVAQAVLETNYADWCRDPITDAMRAEFDFETRPMQLVVGDKSFAIRFKAAPNAVFVPLAQKITAANAGLAVACYAASGELTDCSTQIPPPAEAKCEVKPGPPANAGTTPNASPDAASGNNAPTGGAQGDAAAAPKKDASVLVVTALSPLITDIRLLWNPEDPFSNVLNDSGRVGRAWRVPAARLVEADGPITVTSNPFVARTARARFQVEGANGNANPADIFSAAFNKDPAWAAAPRYKATATAFDVQQLVITAARKGPLEVRYAADKPNTNIMNGAQERAYPILGLVGGSAGAGAIFGESTAWGVLLTWVLLSLGAPFWYDTLKNALKLRPAAAATEERNRRDRATDSAPPAGQSQTRG